MRAALVTPCVILAATAALALEPPPTAESRATTIPVRLSDSSALAFAFPTVTADLDPALFAYGAVGSRFSPGADSGIRLTSRPGSLWYQSVARPVGEASKTSDRFESSHSQAGWARGLGGFRLGASFTWSTDARRERFAELEEDADRRSEEQRTDFDAVDIRCGTSGVGWRGAFLLDAALDVMTETYHWERLVRVHELSPGDDTVRREIDRQEVKTGARFGGGIRILVPVGSRTRLRLAGAWQDVGNELEHERAFQSTRNGVLLIEESDLRIFASGGEELSFGASLEGGVAEDDRGWSVYAWYERIRGAWRYDWYHCPAARRARSRRLRQLPAGGERGAAGPGPATALLPSRGRPPAGESRP